jgi:transposase InsO family protein
MKEWIQQYVKGCGTCQQNKTNTHPAKPLLYPITPEQGATPFSTITMDWATKLPPSLGYYLILTITDHNCSKAVLLFPCKETMGTTDLAKLYFNKVFPHYGVSIKIILDRDPRLTSKLAREICQEADIKQNISTTYHPQTDGQSEQTNQTLKTYLRIFCNK